MKGRHAGASMSIYGAILPGAARLARLPAELSPEAKRRLDIISRWARAYSGHGSGGLEPGSRRRRHHQALGYLTPEEFYQNWLSQHAHRKEVVSYMS